MISSQSSPDRDGDSVDQSLSKAVEFIPGIREQREMASILTHIATAKFEWQCIAAIIAVAVLILAIIRPGRLVNGDGRPKKGVEVYVGEGKKQKMGAKQRWLWGSLDLLREGYAKYAGRPWQVWTSEGYQIVLPPAYVDELKMIPDHSLRSSLGESMLPEYTFKPFDPRKQDYINNVILRDLNKNMSSVFPLIRDEIDAALAIEVTDSPEWIEIDPVKCMLRLVSRISGKAFVGEELYQNPIWLDITCNYTRDFFLSATKLRAVPWMLRSIVAYVLPDLRRVYHHHERARALVQPILQDRMRNEKIGTTKAMDTIQWIHDSLPERDKTDFAFQGVAQLAITSVSIQSTSKLLVNIVLNLMTYPDYVPILKDEVRQVLADCDGVFTLESMNRLEKLDSFIRESLRFEPPLTATFTRRALKQLELSDGTIIPAGALMFAPAEAIAADPQYYPDPSRFDGLRFYNLRQEASQEHKAKVKFANELVATNKTALQFGLGRHACPGRWFASHLIKLVVASLLLNYEFKFRDGEQKLPTFLFQMVNMPNPKTRILIRKIT